MFRINIKNRNFQSRFATK